jgi:hypothetical protein
MHINFLEECLIRLEITSPSMEAQNAHEHILVVGEVCHSLDILDMGMLRKQVQTQYVPIYTRFVPVCTNHE